VDVDQNHLSEREAREEKDLRLALHHEVQLQLTQQLPQHGRVRRQPSVLHTFYFSILLVRIQLCLWIQKRILIGDLDPDPGRKARMAT
jgi:hypothetical protein